MHSGNSESGDDLGVGVAQRLLLYGVVGSLLVLGAADGTPFWTIWYGWQENSALNHAPYVVLFALYVAYGERWRLGGVVIAPSISGWLSALILVTAVYAGRVTGIETLMEISLLAMPLALVWMYGGWDFLRRMSVAWMIYLFVMPFWPAFITPLQNMTAYFAGVGVRWSGIPLFQDQHYLTIPAGSFHIATYCAGIRYFTAGLLVGGFYAYALVGRFWRGLAVVVLAGILAVVGNWLRVYILILLGHLTEMRHPWIEDHEFLGWLVFAAMMIFPLLLARRLESRNRFVRARVARCHVDAAALPRVVMMGLAFVGTVLGLAYLVRSPDGDLTQDVVGSLQFPACLPERWTGPSPSKNQWHPIFPGARSMELSRYRSSMGRDALLFAAEFGRPRPSSEMVSVNNGWFDRFRWRVVASRTWAITGHDAQTIPARELVLRDRRDPDRHVIVLFTYRIFGRYIASDAIAKMLQVPRFLLPESDALVVGVRSDPVPVTSIPAERTLLTELFEKIFRPENACDRPYTPENSAKLRFRAVSGAGDVIDVGEIYTALRTDERL